MDDVIKAIGISYEDEKMFLEEQQALLYNAKINSNNNLR